MRRQLCPRDRDAAELDEQRLVPGRMLLEEGEVREGAVTERKAHSETSVGSHFLFHLPACRLQAHCDRDTPLNCTAEW